MASTRAAVLAPPLFTMTISKGTAGFAAATDARHSSSRSIRFQVTIRIETTGSVIEPRQPTQLGDAPDGLHALPTRGPGRRASVEIAEECVELALERRIACDVDSATIAAGLDLDHHVAFAVENRDGVAESDLDAASMLRPMPGYLHRARRIAAQARGDSRNAAVGPLGNGGDRRRQVAEDLAQNREIVRQQRPDRIDVLVRVVAA